MKSLRKGREHYSKNYERAILLYKEGKGIKEIAQELKVSYSAVYHWVKKLRKPDTGRVNKFESFLLEKGPTPVIDIKEKFPKHNEIFLTAVKRGIVIKRLFLNKRLGEYSTWYYLPDQKDLMQQRVDELKEALKKIKKRIS